MTREELEKSQLICQKYLSNADIFDIQHKEDSVLLKFITGDEASWIEIQIECFQIQLFSMTKSWDEPMSEGFFVGETNLKFFDKFEEIKTVFDTSKHFLENNYFPKQCYRLEIDGGITMEIICVEVNVSFIRREDNNV